MGAQKAGDDDVFFHRGNDELRDCYERLRQFAQNSVFDIELHLQLETIVAELHRRGSPW